MKMAFGNGLGFDFCGDVSLPELFGYAYGSFVLELAGCEPVGQILGTVNDSGRFTWRGESVDGAALQRVYEEKLEPVYPCNIPDAQVPVETVSFQAQDRVSPAVKTARPRVLIPVFPGTNCEYDSAKAMDDAGADAEIFVIRNRTAAEIAQSVERFAQALQAAQIVFIPGGFSGGDEPDGSGKFITAFFRNAAVREEVTALLERRDGLMLGICNGFQALIKLGLVPYGKILGCRCRLPHPDLQCHWPPSVPAGSDPGGLQPEPLAGRRPGWRGVYRPHLPWRGPVPGGRGAGEAAGGAGPNCNPVCGFGRPGYGGCAL